MLRTHSALVALLLSVASTSVSAEEIAWNKIVGIEPGKLTPRQKERVEANLKRLSNTRGCKGSLASCIKEGDVTASRHAGFVVRMVRKEKGDEFIEGGIKRRHESAFPKEKFEIDLSGHPLIGNPRAKVVFVEYACFQCPFCAHLSSKLKSLRKLFKDNLAHYYKFFPVRSHPRGVPTALAAIAAHRQGKFWPLHDLMYANRADLEEKDLLEYAKKTGLDIEKWQSDRKDPSAMRYLEKDKLEGMRFGVEGTPTFFVNGKMFKGVNDYDEIVDRISEELDILEGRIR